MGSVKYLGRVKSSELQLDSVCRDPEVHRWLAKNLREFVNTSSENQSPSLRWSIRIHFVRLTPPEKKHKILHLCDMAERVDLDMFSESPGLPWINMGYKTTDDIRRDKKAINEIRYFAHRLKLGEHLEFPDCLVYVRSHTNEKGKCEKEIVWEYPATVKFMECMFVGPVIRTSQEVGLLSSSVATKIFRATMLKKMCQGLSSSGTYFVRLKFSNFNNTVPPWLIKVAFDFVSLNVNFCRYENVGVPDARFLYRLYTTLVDYFIRTTIRTTNGSRYQKFSGIPGGSCYTWLVSSMCNSILTHWMFFYQFKVFPNYIVCLGDESLISSQQEWDFKICQDLMHSIQMKLDLKKCEQSRKLSDINIFGCKDEKDKTEVFSRAEGKKETEIVEEKEATEEVQRMDEAQNLECSKLQFEVLKNLKQLNYLQRKLENLP